METQPPVESAAHPGPVPGGTQRSPTYPRSRGERIVAFAVAGGILAAFGLLFSSFTATAWAVVAIGIIVLGLAAAAVGAFLGFSSGHSDAGTICAGVATAAVVMLVIALSYQIGARDPELATDADAAETPTQQQNPPRPLP